MYKLLKTYENVIDCIRFTQFREKVKCLSKKLKNKIFLEGTALRVLKGIIVALLVILNSTLALCAVGEGGPAILKMNYGSRLISLGGAFVGLADDPFYMDSNPAGGQKDTLRVSVLHQEWIEDVNHENLRFTIGFDRFKDHVFTSNLDSILKLK